MPKAKRAGSVHGGLITEYHIGGKRTVYVVRDDLIPGGTKARVLPRLFDGKSREYVYASPVQGYAQVALAYCCREYGYKATIFCAARRDKHPLTLEVISAGGNVIEVGPCGYLSVVTKRAKDYCAGSSAVLLPFGLMDGRVRAGLVDVAKSVLVGHRPTEIWSVASSGTLSLSLQAAFPRAEVHAVRVGAVRDLGRAIIHTAPERYEQPARIETPFPSCENYDKKAWRFILAEAKDGALFWNVAGNPGEN